MKQDWLLSLLLFNIALNWILKTESNEQLSIIWDLQSRLGDLDYPENWKVTN